MARQRDGAAGHARGFSLRRIAKRLGISSSLISRLSTGRARPLVSAVHTVADRIDLGLDAYERKSGRMAQVVYGALFRLLPVIAHAGSLGRRLLARALFTGFRRDEVGWQDRVLAAGDPCVLVRWLDRRARWSASALVDDWPAYPVRVAGVEAWLIVSRDLSRGFPLRAAFFPGSGDVMRSGDGDHKHVTATVDALRARSFPTQDAPGIGGLVVGNPNFAHVFLGTWNALQRGRKVHGFRAVDRFHDLLAHTMGSYTEPELFPELADRVAPLDAFVTADGTYDGTLVPIGMGRGNVLDLRLDTDLRRAVARVAERVRSPEATMLAAPMAAARFVLWISVRAAGKRTAVNFVDWIRATLAAVVGAGLEPFVAFDGLSIQPGYGLESVVRGAVSGEQVGREREVVERIMDGSPLEYAHLGGLPLYDAFYLSRFTSYFVCHQGSLEHKIKWLNPELPGMVHANLQRTRGRAWEPTFDTERTQFLPARFIVDEMPPSYADKPVSHANYPYLVEPVTEAAAFVAARILAARRVRERRAGQPVAVTND